MPLHKKKPFPLVEPPEDLGTTELVYQIRFTNEILRDFQDYLNRLNFYRQRVWTCKITGKTNLTYEEALVSERRAAEKVHQFPEGLMAPVLKIIQYNQDSLKEEPFKYPINDLLVQPAADDPPFSDCPSLGTDFKVPMDCVGDLLMIWHFCSSFGRLLNLWRFSLEDFESAICHKDSNLVLIVEVHAAILRLLIKDEGNYFTVIQRKKRKSKITLITWTEFLCDFLEMEGREEFTEYFPTIKRGHYGLLAVNVKLSIIQVLVAEALTSTVIRARLDECIEQQQALALKGKEDNKRRKEEQHPKDTVSDNQGQQQDCLENGKGDIFSSYLDSTSAQNGDVSHVGTQKIKASKRDHMNGERNHHLTNSEELKMDNGNYPEMVNNVSAAKEGTNDQHGRRHKTKGKKKQPKGKQRNNLEKELEKLSIRTNPLGKDRNYNRYWFFQREGRLFVESSDSKLWGYYTTKGELDALMGSLNPKGERERALQAQLEKSYERISAALEKRSKEVAQKALLEEGELRRSTRVRTPTRHKPAFFAYANKWKDD